MLSDPPRDFQGVVTPHDHEGISDTDLLIRGVVFAFPQVVPDPKCVSGQRLSSAVFNQSTDKYKGISVDLQAEIELNGLDPATYVRSNGKWAGAVVIRADSVRQLGGKVGYSPLPGNVYHGEIWGEMLKRLSAKNALLRACSWLVPLPGVDLRPSDPTPTQD